MSTMKQHDIDQALNSLGSALKQLNDKKTEPLNFSEIAKNLPHRSLSGDHIHGGTIRNFNSSGIQDLSTNKVLIVTDTGIESSKAKIPNLIGNVDIEGSLTTDSIIVKKDLVVSGVLRANVEFNYADFVKQVPKRSISGDLIFGGTIRNFSSAGIKDSADTLKVVITNDLVSIDVAKISVLKGNVAVEGDLSSNNLNVEGTLKAGIIEVKELRADLRLERSTPLEFKASAENPIYGKGLLWSGVGPTKQFILSNPDRFLSTEHVDLMSGKHYQVGGVKVLDEKELGPTVRKSNLTELGALKKLTVLGDVNLDNFLIYNSDTRRLGLGTETPNSTVSIVQHNVELMFDISAEQTKVGNYGYQDFSLITDNQVRLTIKNDGNIILGNKNSPPTNVHVHGTVSIGVSQPDPTVDLHVRGAVKFNNKLHTYADSAPAHGSFNQGDIVWNSNPRIGSSVGWVCTRSGTPGDWRSFGEIS